jgi:cytochrome d ubiquinol oxidase subunit I
VLAAFVSTGFAAAGVHAICMLRGSHKRSFHQHGLRMALAMGAVGALLQPLSGDLSAKDVARRQPAKLAAMEALYETQRGAPLVIGGIPDDEARTVRGAIEIPKGLSFLAFADPNAEVTGLDRIPRDEWPPTLVTHLAFQVMVGLGSLLALVAAAFLLARWRRPQLLNHRLVLGVIAACTPLGFLAVEAGWTVTEVGRQPWIIYGVMRTAAAVSPMPGLKWSFLSIMVLYGALGAVTWFVVARLIRASEHGTVDEIEDEDSAGELAEHAAHG